MNLGELLKKHREIFSGNKIANKNNKSEDKVHNMLSTNKFSMPIEKSKKLDTPKSTMFTSVGFNPTAEFEYPEISSEEKQINQDVKLWDELSNKIALERRKFSQLIEEEE